MVRQGLVCWGLRSGWVCVITLACGWTGQAAELQVRSECQSRGAMVTLGDVVEIRTSDASQREELAAVELFPAPPAGAKRFVRAREIQDMLLMHGVNLAQHQFSGAAQVAVVGTGMADQDRSPGLLPLALVKKSERRLNESIVGYLKDYAGAQAWNAESALDGRQARLVAAAEKIVVCGGTAPWQGSQHFEVTTYGPAGATRFEVLAQVTVRPSVVVLTRSVGRGEVITAADVELMAGDPADANAVVFHAVEEVVGKEARQAMSAGNAVAREAVQAPVIVRRGEVVTVYARSSGIRVRTMARAREDGSLDDLVTVESLDTRKSFFARVCGVQEVEIYAQAVQTREPAAPAASRSPVAAAKPKAESVVHEGELTSWNAPKQVSNTRMQLRAE